MKHAALRFVLAGLPVVTAMMLVADEPPRVTLQDRCQPATFNLDPPAGAGPGTCRADFGGDTPFGDFIKEIIKKHKAEHWRIAQSPEHVDVGTTLLVSNEGGETHSFTRVQNFGGGIVPILNDLSGQTMLAGECFDPNVGGSFVPSQANGQMGPMLTAADRGKTVRFQCCIHPWMRTEVRVR
jgi:hypothetical protein